MANVLSQEEIDSLLEALSSGELSKELLEEESKKVVKEYNFKRPDKFSKDQIRTFQMIHANFGRTWSTLLSGKLRSLVQIELEAVDQITYEEFLRSIIPPSIIGIVSMKPLEGRCVVDIQPDVAFPMLDRLLGGFGLTLGKARELTEIEENLIIRVIEDMLNNLRNAWREVQSDLKPRIDGNLEAYPHFVQVVPPSDMVVFITFEAIIGGEKRGRIGLCYPAITLEPILHNLSTDLFFTTRGRPTAESRGLIEKTLRELGLDLVAELGQAHLSVDEVTNLNEGDVIVLDNRTKEDIAVKIGGRTKFLAAPGRVGKRLALRLTDEVKEN